MFLLSVHLSEGQGRVEVGRAGRETLEVQPLDVLLSVFGVFSPPGGAKNSR